MKSQTQSLSAMLSAGTIGVFSLFATHAVLAIDGLPDNAKPPAELENRVEAPDVIAAKLPFIGVVTASLPETVAKHHNLEPGIGVIVNSVSPKSPADLAGIKPNDIILKINANDVNDPEAFRVQIRSGKIGDMLKLKAIQKGKPVDLDVTLAERPAEAFADIQNQELPLDGEQNVQRLEFKIEGVIDDALDGALGEGEIEERIIPNLLADEQLKNMPEHMKDALKGMLNGGGIIQLEGGNNPQFNAQSSVQMMDDKGSIELKTMGENKEVTVRDGAKEILWSGPWDTEQDKAAAPNDIRLRIEKLTVNHPGALKIEIQE